MSCPALKNGLSQRNSATTTTTAAGLRLLLLLLLPPPRSSSCCPFVLLTVLELQVLDGDIDNGGVLLHEEVVAGEAGQVEDEVAGQLGDPVTLALVYPRPHHILSA